MTEPIDHTNLHRTAKYFMDSGRAASPREALGILKGFGLTVRVEAAVASRAEHQIALLTLVNLARRTMLAGVEIVDVPDVPLRLRLTKATTLRAAVKELGGRLVAQSRPDWPVAIIGDVKPDTNASRSWRMTWEGWRGGVIPSLQDRHLADDSIMPLAPAMAAATCVAEAFAFHAGDHPMAGRRAAGISLWQPGRDWLEADDSEPGLCFLPTRLWLIGLGNLGQAYAWLLACLPYARPADLELMLQDFDKMAKSNDSTSLLASRKATGSKKTRWVAAWLERRGFITAIEERLFDERTRRMPDEPGVALCGVDNALARASLEKAGFDLVIESGLGAGTQAFRSFSLHSFPGARRADHLWAKATADASPDVSTMPAYDALRQDGADQCGVIQMASRTIGVPFVGLIAGGLVIGEVLRRLHGAAGLDLVSGSALCLDDVETAIGAKQPYFYGHIAI